MTAFRSFAVAFVVVLVTLCALFSLSAHSAPTMVIPAPHDDETMPAPQIADAPDDGQGEVDLFGNDVSDAVARYRFDAAGSLYEVHSPQTEIPKLGSPRS